MPDGSPLPTGRSPAADGALPASAGVSLAEVVAGPERAGRVLAGFPTACYVLPAGHRALALVGRGGVVLPNALVVASPLPAALAEGDPERLPVTVGAGRLRVGPLTVQVDRWVDRRPRLTAEGPSTVPAALVHLEELLVAAPPLPDPVAERVSALSAALDAHDAAGARAAADDLVGLGEGLTPSGDDVLAGVLAAGRVAATARGDHRLDRELHDLGGHVVTTARERTTALSAALLWHAARGEVAEPARHVLRALHGATPLEPAVRALLRVGHSSGRDLAVGIVLGVGLALAHSSARGANA